MSLRPHTALGFGFRCGFLGLLHMEIIQERIEREFGIPLITTAPSVVYRIYQNRWHDVGNRKSDFDAAEMQKIDRVEEPYVKASIMVPNDYVGDGDGNMSK